MPPGTKAAILRAVISERHPRNAIPAIAHRFGVLVADVKHVIDAAGYPDNAKMRAEASDLEQQEAADSARLFQEPAQPAEEKLGDDSGSSTYDGPRTDVEPHEHAAASGDELGELVRLRLADVHPDPDNLRDLPSVDDPDIVELADSMTELGLLQPITVRRHEGRLVISMGHRRYVAARRLKWSTIPGIVKGPQLPADVIATMLIENGQRKDLNPIEEARGLHLLKTRHELSDAVLARKVGRGQAYVSARLALLALSAEEQAALIAGDMSLIEGTAKGRMNSGRVRATGQDKNWHLGPHHDLAQQAKARCQRLGHPKGRRIGGMACGECWESVIRADARQGFVEISQRSGTCAICTQPVERQVEPIGAGR